MASLHRHCHLKQRTRGGASQQVAHRPTLAAVNIHLSIQQTFMQTPLLAQAHSLL